MTGLHRYVIFRDSGWWHEADRQWRVAVSDSDSHGIYYKAIYSCDTWQEAMDQVNRCLSMDSLEARSSTLLGQSSDLT